MITGFVKGQNLRISQPLVVSDTIDYLEADFIFQTADWTGLSKWAHFSQGEKVYDIMLTEDKIRREDHLNLSAGEWKVYLHGTFPTGSRVTTEVKTITVKPTGMLDGQPLPEIPLSAAEQIAQIAQSVRDDADAGKFNGERGPVGPMGSAGPVGPAGPRGETGETGKAGPVGPAGKDGKNFEILAVYPTLEDLQKAHPAGNPGEVYAVGTESKNTIYIWDVDKKEWGSFGSIQGPEGPRGPRGERGETGLIGPAGPKGNPGERGPVGPAGPKGDTGPIGPKGDTGPVGETGPRGEQGIQGKTGLVGPIGPVGPAGPMGEAGPAGERGPQGARGETGLIGPAGPAGAKGETGPKGETGASGQRGERGPQGPTGIPGPIGPRGRDGKTFDILGLYPTLQALQAAHATGQPGNAYSIGTAEKNSIYIWDVDKKAWTDIGPLQAPAINDHAVAPDLTWSSQMIAESFCPKSVSVGTVATTQTALGGVPIVEAVTSFGPIQEGSGGPSLDNIRNIVGLNRLTLAHRGKNLVCPEIISTSGSSATAATGENGEIICDNTAYPVRIYIDLMKKLLPAEVEMVLSTAPRAKENRIYLRGDDPGDYEWSNNRGRENRTLQRPEAYGGLVLVDGGEKVHTGIQAEIGHTATAYEPYHGEDLAADFGKPIYGGMLNWTTGKLTVTHAMLSLKVSDMNNNEDFPGWRNTDVKHIVGSRNDTSGFYAVMSNVGGRISTNTENKYDASIVFMHKDNFNLTQSQWKAQYPDLVIQAVFAYREDLRPVIQLTPRQMLAYQGINTAFSDHGATQLTLYQDPKLVIAQLQNAMLGGLTNV